MSEETYGARGELKAGAEMMIAEEKTDRNRIRASRKIFEGWLETTRGKQFLHARYPGTAIVSMSTGQVTVRRPGKGASLK